MSVPHEDTAKNGNERNQNGGNPHTSANVMHEGVNISAAVRIFWINLLFHFFFIKQVGCAEFNPRRDEFSIVFERFDTYIYVQKKNRRKNAPNDRNE